MKKHALILLFLIPWLGCAQQKPQLQNHMVQLRATLIRLAPFLQDKASFKSSSNQELIQEEMLQLKNHSAALSGHPQINDRGMPLTLSEIQEQFTQAEQSFRAGNKDAARWQLNSSLGLCLHCHSQAPGRYSLALTPQELEALPTNPMTRADLLFILRDFKSARHEYEKILGSTHSFDSELNRLYKSFNRLLFLAVRFDQDFSAVKQLLLSARENKRFPALFKQQVQQLESFLEQQVFYRPIIAQLNDAQLQTFLKSYQPAGRDFSIDTDLYSPQELQELWLAGELFERLAKDKSAELRALVYFTLARIDERSGENLFYSLSNRYLEECIHLTPNTAQALACFDDLNERLVFAYSGSGGTDLPRDVSSKLKKLRQLSEP